jgi:hypothetical protein
MLVGTVHILPMMSAHLRPTVSAAFGNERSLCRAFHCPSRCGCASSDIIAEGTDREVSALAQECPHGASAESLRVAGAPSLSLRCCASLSDHD